MNISEVKRNLGRKVKYNDTEYLFTGCTLRKDENGFYYQAEIKDLSAKSALIFCRLEDIKEMN